MDNTNVNVSKISPKLSDWKGKHASSLNDLERIKEEQEKLIVFAKNKIDSIDEFVEKCFTFNLNDLTSVLAFLISSYEGKKYIVEKGCYISTRRNYTTRGVQYIPTFQNDMLVIINKSCSQSQAVYYDYYVEDKLNSRDLLMLNKYASARDAEKSNIEYSGHYDNDKMLQFNNKYSLDGSDVISIKKDAFDKFEYVHKFVKYLIDRKIENTVTNLSVVEMYGYMNAFLIERFNLDQQVKINKKIS
jgi:hypothetical protein